MKTAVWPAGACAGLVRPTEDNKFIRKMTAHSSECPEQIQQDHVKESDPVRCRSCQKDLETGSVYVRAGRASEDSQEWMQIKPVSRLGFHL